MSGQLRQQQDSDTSVGSSELERLASVTHSGGWVGRFPCRSAGQLRLALMVFIAPIVGLRPIVSAGTCR